MDKLTSQFIQIRNHVVFSATEKLQTFVSDIWDPYIKFIIIREINEMLDKELIEMYPDFPQNLFPLTKFRINEDEKQIEIGVQTYLNQNPDLNFLGVGDLNDGIYDLYVGESWSSNENYKLFARYGHYAHNVFEGGKAAEDEYFLGMFTPLSAAYSMAVQDGFIF